MYTVHVRGLAAILAELAAIPDWCQLDRWELGKGLMDVATEEIMAAMDLEQDPDGMPWLPLDPDYAAEKAVINPGAPMAVLYGYMKTWNEVAGVRFINTYYAEMTYGVTPRAIIEAQKFTYGGAITGTKQPPRPFYGLTATAIARMESKVDSQFNAAW